MSEPVTILAVDDEPGQLSLIENYLEEGGFHVVSAQTQEDCLQILSSHKEPVNAIVLDQSLPNSGGFKLLERLSHHDDFKYIPIITQNGLQKSSLDEASAYMNAGAFYHFSDPINPKLLQSVVTAAVKDYKRIHDLQEELTAYHGGLVTLEKGHFAFNQLSNAQSLAQMLARLFPEPNAAVVGVTELLINALEHGNLGIGYEEKTQLMEQAAWKEEVERRQALAEFQAKKVNVLFEKGCEEIRLTIKDEGKGFDWQDYLEMKAERAGDPHGRGIALANMMSFTSLQYEDEGSKAIATVRMSKGEQGL